MAIIEVNRYFVAVEILLIATIKLINKHPQWHRQVIIYTILFIISILPFRPNEPTYLCTSAVKEWSPFAIHNGEMATRAYTYKI